MAFRAPVRVVAQSMLSERARPWLDSGRGTVSRNEHSSSPLGKMRVCGSTASNPRSST
jgi:hypothetical protein